MKRGCRRAREALLDLPGDVAPQVVRHLESCPSCRSFWEGWRWLGPALKARDLPEPVDRALIEAVLARSRAIPAAPERRPLARDLVPALLLGSLVAAIQAGAWSLWGRAGLAAVQATATLLLPWVILGAVRHDFGPPWGEQR